MSQSGDHPPRERLVFVEDAVAKAAGGFYPTWGVLLAIDRSLPLLTSEQPVGWRDENADIIRQICTTVRSLVPVLVDAVRGRIDQDTCALGLGSLAAAISDPDASFFADRISFARILLCELSILLEREAIAARGHGLVHDINARLGLMAAPSPSAYVN